MTSVDFPLIGLCVTLPILALWRESGSALKRLIAVIPLLAIATLLMVTAIQAGLPIGETGQGERFTPIFVGWGLALLAVAIMTALRHSFQPYSWLFVILAFSPIFVQALDKHQIGYGIIVALALWFFVGYGSPRLTLHDAPLLLLGLSGVAGLITGVNRHAVLVNAGYHVAFLLCYLSLRALLQQPEDAKALVRSAAITLGMISFLGLAKLGYNAVVLGIDRPWNLKIWLAGNHPNALAAYILFMLPVAFSGLWLVQSRLAKALVITSVTSGIIVIAVCRSRSVMGSLLATLGLALVVYAVKLRKRWLTGVAIIGVFALILVIVAAVPHLKVESRAAKGYDSLWFRLFLWQLGWQSFSDHPLGVGLGNHWQVASKITEQQYEWREHLINWLGWDRLGRHCHQFLTEMALTTGILGILAVLSIFLLWFSSARKIIRSSSSPAIAGWLSVFAFLLTTLNDCPIYYPGNYLMLWLGAALMASAHQENPTQGFRIPRWTAIPVWLMFALYPAALPYAGERSLDRAETGHHPYDKLSGWLSYLDPGPIRTFGFNRFQLENLPMTITALNQTLVREPSDPRVLSLLGWLDITMNPHAPKTTMFQQAISVDPMGVLDQNQHVDYALALFYLGNTEAAGQALQSSLLYGSDLKKCSLWVEDADNLNWRFEVGRLNDYLAVRFGMSQRLAPQPPPVPPIPLQALLKGITDRARVMRTQNETTAKSMILKVASYYWQTEAARIGLELLDEFDLTPDLVHGETSLPMVTVVEGDPESLRASGIQALSRGDADQAIDYFRQLRRTGVDDNRLRNGLAEAYLKQGSLRNAIAEYEKILLASGDIPEILVNLAVCLRQVGNQERAESILLDVLKSDRTNSRALFNLGTLYLETQATNKAIGYLKHCLSFEPDYLPALFNLAVALEQDGRPAEAVVYYQQYLAKARQNSNDPLRLEAEQRLRFLTPSP